MRKITAIALSLSFSVAALPFAASAAVPKAPPAAAKNVPGWYIEQKMEYRGIVKIYAGPTHSKVVTRSLTIYLNQKDDQGILVNEAAKTQTVLDKRSWTDSNFVNAQLVKDVPEEILKRYKVPKSPPKIIAGHKCIQHWAAAYRNDKTFWFWWEYWTPTDVKLSSEISNQWRSMMRLPVGDTVPFAAIRHLKVPGTPGTARSKPMEFLSTLQAKQMPIPIAELTVPAGYKKVGDELDSVLGDDEKNNELDKLFATKSGDKKKP